MDLDQLLAFFQALTDSVDAGFPDRSPGDALHQQDHDLIHQGLVTLVERLQDLRDDLSEVGRPRYDFRVDTGWLQWAPEGTDDWANLIEITELGISESVVTGMINVAITGHNTSGTAHADIRQLIADIDLSGGGAPIDHDHDGDYAPAVHSHPHSHPSTLPSTAGHIIVEIGPGIWSGTVPSGRSNGHNPVIFVSETNPEDSSNGVPGASNIRSWDTWLPRTEPSGGGDPGGGTGGGDGGDPGSGDPDVMITAQDGSGTGMWDQNNGASGTFSNVTVSGEGIPGYTGPRAFKAEINSGGGNKYARGVHIPSPTISGGEDWWWGAAFYLPPGFVNNIQEHVSLIGWDAYVDGNADMQGRLQIISNGDLLLQKGSNPYGAVLQTSGFDIPEGEWVWVEVRELLSSQNGVARNEIWVNDVKIAENTTANFQSNAYPSNEQQINRLRVGIVSINSSQQTLPLTVFCDRMTISRTARVGGL